MANPDQPIPDAPKDWMPPMPRPETPPAEEESDHDSDAGNEVSHPAAGDYCRDESNVGVRRCCCCGDTAAMNPVLVYAVVVVAPKSFYAVVVAADLGAIGPPPSSILVI